MSGFQDRTGCKNKLTLIREAFGEAFDSEEMGGAEGLAKWAKDHKGQFYKILAKILPKEIHGTVEHKHEDFIRFLQEQDAKKKLEAGQPIKMIDTDGVQVGNNGQKEPVNGEDTSQKT